MKKCPYCGDEKKPQVTIFSELQGSMKNVIYLLGIIFLGIPILLILLGVIMNYLRI